MDSEVGTTGTWHPQFLLPPVLWCCASQGLRRLFPAPIPPKKGYMAYIKEGKAAGDTAQEKKTQ